MFLSTEMLRVSEALVLLEEMHEQRIRANTIVYNSVLKACEGDQWQVAGVGGLVGSGPA